MADPQTAPDKRSDLGVGFTVLLLAISVSGLVLLGFRDTTAMAILLIIHLGFVFAFFLLLPYSKFVHGFYRLAALLQHHRDLRIRAG